MYSPGQGKYGAEAFDWRELELLEGSDRIWLFPGDDDNIDSWCFVLPLTELSNEEALKNYIVSPVIKLLKVGDIDNLKKSGSSDVFSADNPAFRFSKDGEEITILR